MSMLLNENVTPEFTREQLEFLSMFKKGLNIDDKNIQGFWNSILKGDFSNTITRFEEDKLIGKSYHEQGAENQNHYSLTLVGMIKIADYQTIKEEEKREAERKVDLYLNARDFESVCLTMADYEKNKVSYIEGIGIDTKRYYTKADVAGLQQIFSEPPKIFDDMSDDKIEIIQMAAAKAFLYQSGNYNKFLPKGFETGIQINGNYLTNRLVLKGYGARNLASYKENSDAHSGVEIHSYRDSCEECKKITGKKYRLDDILELPYEHCTHELGCRCFYFPIRFS
jgi:hypothetical protein